MWQYFYIEALEDGVSFSFPYDLEYKIDEGDWILLSSGSLSDTITKGSRMSIRGDFPGNTNTIKTFNIKGLCKIGGDLKSLSYKELAKDVSIVSISQYCYLFQDCTTITEAESDLLTATTLDDFCYAYMFRGCTGLIKAPELPATTLDDYCYAYMFNGCTNLNYIKMLATDISARYCLGYWVEGVSPTGTFVKSKDATWDVVGDSGVPTGWTVITDDQESGGGEITFYVNDVAYTALDGMTWEEWVNSEYNIDGFYIINDKTYKGDKWIYTYGEPYTVISNNAKYTLYEHSGGGSAD